MTDARLPARTAWAVALVATSTMAVSYVDRQAVAALAPTITQDLGISDADFGLLGSAFSIAYLVFAPLAGRLIDRVGARRGLVASVIVWSVVAAAHALVPGFAALFALRILLGCAEAPSFPGAAQTVERVLPPASRSAGFGVLFTGSSIGAAISATLAPTLAAEWGWRAALVGTAVVGLAWVPMWLWVTGPPAVREALSGGTRATTAPTPWRELLRNRAVLRAVAAVLATAPVVGLVLQFGAKVLVTDHGLTQTEVREWLWIPPLAFDAGAVGLGALAAWRTRAGGRRLGLFAVAVALTLAIGLLRITPDAASTTLAMSIAMAGGGGAYALATSDMLARVPRGAVAAAGGLTAAAQSLALIVALPLIGGAADRSHSYAGVGMLLAAWTLPGCLVWLGLRDRSASA